ncbi:uncharacterized protein EHS24_002081 [Apiotrichum porosum]|uniref:Uncharacterized protein n=1 Tax=Apiotrichum porosum TaxID=105984 RepID=A0A427XHN3_9TREE|nr:uncharacterized protein EHS24_002081 [Apiotrichum porosum]RSH78358.1 hypothetical protein EHS24_002081 [Apiotrichum porosum]
MALTIFRLETLPVPLEIALGLLPPMDPELLGLALQAVVREKRPTPTLVRDAIIGCLQAGDEPTEKETWHWELWAALLDAYVASSTYKDALETLMEFVQIVKTTKAEALENDQCWPDERQGLITSMYTKLVKFWISCSTTVPSNLPEGAKVPPRIRREGSIVPTHLFMDLVLVLSPGRSDDGLSKVQLSRDFLVHYINAERIAGNVDTAMRGWEKLSGQTYEETLAGQQPPSELDDKSWFTVPWRL